MNSSENIKFCQAILVIRGSFFCEYKLIPKVLGRNKDFFRLWKWGKINDAFLLYYSMLFPKMNFIFFLINEKLHSYEHL